MTSEPSVSPATIDSANTNSEKYSHGPNSSAIAASGPVAPIRNTPASRPPRKDDQMPSQTARPGCPFCVIGKPSKVVVIADGRAGNADQRRGDRAAGRAADVDAGHRRQALQRIESEGERQHDDDGHGDGDAGQRAADQSDERAERTAAPGISGAGCSTIPPMQGVRTSFTIPVQRPRGSSTDR